MEVTLGHRYRWHATTNIEFKLIESIEVSVFSLPERQTIPSI